MIEIRKILFPTDFSDAAMQAFNQALFLAEEFHAQLHILHAVTLGGSFTDFDLPFPEREELMRRLFDITDSELGRIRRAAQSDRPECAVEIVEAKRHGADPGSVILAYAKEIAADLIVMGSHGRRGPSHWLLGSVAEEVIRRSPQPVITMRARRRREAETPELPALRRILVPIDFATEPAPAIEAARQMAQRFDGGLQLLHVVDLHTLPAFYGIAMGEISDRMRRQSDVKLRRIAEAAGDDVPIECATTSGGAAEGIIDFAARHRSNLIVIPSRGRTGLDHWLVGSTAERIARAAPCPVLTLKSARSSSEEARRTARATPSR